MTKNTGVLVSLTLAAFMASCSTPESYETKISRYKNQPVGMNQVPEIVTTGFEFTKKTSRGPAAITPAQLETSVETSLSAEATLSNKKLYFLTLFGQYESMKKYSSQFEAPVVNVCPHFHNSLLEHNGKKPATFAGNITHKNNKKFQYDMTKLNDVGYVALHPELSLPLEKDGVNPKVIDIFRSQASTMNDVKMDEMVHKAIDIHLTKTYSEIRELCENGVSDNYYVYENLITHIKTTSFTAAEKNMNTLLKTTVFSNIALVTALEKIQATPMRSIASIESKKDVSVPYSNELMTRLNVEWAQEYFNYLKTSK